MSNDNNKLVQTVWGPVELDNLGITLTHEHLSCRFEQRYESKLKWLCKEEYAFLNSINIYKFKQHPYSNYKNMTFNDTLNVMPYELSLFKDAGGTTIVENTSKGLLSNIYDLKYYSKRNKINIIVGTGYYTAYVQNDSIINQTTEEIYNVMFNDLTNNITDDNTELDEADDNSKIKAGFIGEIGSSWPIHEFEKSSIRATGEIQAQMHYPVNLSPVAKEEALREVIRLYEEAGGDSRKAAISNIDRTLWYQDKFMEFIDDTRYYIQLDLFGTEHSFCKINDTYYKVLSDAQRIKRIAKLKEEGNLHRVHMSHDIHTKDRLVSFGGHGYAHILKNIVPHILRRNFTIHDIKMLTVENPKRWLCWNH